MLWRSQVGLVVLLIGVAWVQCVCAAEKTGEVQPIVGDDSDFQLAHRFRAVVMITANQVDPVASRC